MSSLRPVDCASNTVFCASETAFALILVASACAVRRVFSFSFRILLTSTFVSSRSTNAFCREVSLPLRSFCSLVSSCFRATFSGILIRPMWNWSSTAGSAGASAHRAVTAAFRMVSTLSRFSKKSVKEMSMEALFLTASLALLETMAWYDVAMDVCSSPILSFCSVYVMCRSSTNSRPMLSSPPDAEKTDSPSRFRTCASA
mmetsp:Transcript_1097/g.4901  ORF Transcript_1097/g.4901 Transcript_1097/m.4901 type:complete len:201 (+) Transcript_1097:225-827(+)